MMSEDFETARPFDTVRASDVEEKMVQWLWNGRIPVGKLTLLEGDPGQAKTTLALDLAARVTTGRAFPEDPRTRKGGARVLMLSTEDEVEDTLAPRLRVAGGDKDKFEVVTMPRDSDGYPKPLSFPEDLNRFAATVQKLRPRLVIIDPVSAFTSAKINSISDSSVRQMLMPMMSIAADARTALVGIRHLNKKGEGPAIYRGAGSIAYGGAARSVMLVGNEPHSENEAKVLVSVKNNLAARPDTLRYHIVQDGKWSKIEWGGVVDLSADAVHGVGGGGTRGPAPVRRNAAEDALRKLLEDGDWMDRNDIMRELVKNQGLAQATVYRAAKSLHVKRTSPTEDRGTMWRLP